MPQYIPEFERKKRKEYVVDRLGGKVRPQEVNYRPSPEDGKQSCAECGHYLMPGEEMSNCRRVAGIVEGNDMCDLFVAREEEGGGTSSISISINARG